MTLKTHDNHIRKQVYAGSFYPADKTKLLETIERLVRQTENKQPDLPHNKHIKALILPHAGYIYSGLTAAYAVPLLKKRSFSKVILLGTDHKVGFPNCSVSGADSYETPLGLIPIDKEKIKNLMLRKNIFGYVDTADKTEHSLEVILPFLQYGLKNFELTPIIIGYGNIAEYSKTISSIADDDTLLVASTDLSHYMTYEQALKKDKETLQNILELNSEKLSKNKNGACGIMPVLTLIEIAKKRNWKPFLVHYSNSGDTAGNRERVVGYASIAFYENQNHEKERICELQGNRLLKLARYTLANKFGKADKDTFQKLKEELERDNNLKKKSGTFVTLHIDDNLRGCIGNIISNKSILKGIEDNAVNAAFNDTRFRPLTENELDMVNLEVSILTEPLPLQYSDPEDLLGKLRINIDGVILRKGANSATFLPQVWEQLPAPDIFLSHLSAKAGLLPDAWRTDKLDIFTYQVQYFKE